MRSQAHNLQLGIAYLTYTTLKNKENVWVMTEKVWVMSEKCGLYRKKCGLCQKKYIGKSVDFVALNPH